MNRLLALLVLGLVAGVALADIPPPPPPKGMKYVSVNNEVVLGKDVTGYVFVKQVARFPGGQKPTYAKVELGTEKPTAIPNPVRTFVVLFAVPADAAKEFKTDGELFDALGANKVKAAQKIDFTSTATVSDKVKGDSVKWTHTITTIDAKGIKKTVEGEGYEDRKKPKDGGKNPPGDAPEDDSDAPIATTAPRGGVWVAGLAAFAGVTLGGFWLAGRVRRKV